MDGKDSIVTNDGSGSSEMSGIFKRTEEPKTKENNYRIEMEKMRDDVRDILSMMKAQNQNRSVGHPQIQAERIPAQEICNIEAP
ncbi:hypothetical protein K3495_g17272, partial [Podosphaera aphanis]